ncbi:MAG: hypothetical protein WC121_08500 [Candidatus Kapaibacterium sp.]
MNLDIIQTEITDEEKKYAIAIALAGFKSDGDFNEHDLHFLGTYIAHTGILKDGITEEAISNLFTEIGNLMDEDNFESKVLLMDKNIKMKGLSLAFELILKSSQLNETTFGSFLSTAKTLEIEKEDQQKIIDVFSYLYY